MLNFPIFTVEGKLYRQVNDKAEVIFDPTDLQYTVNGHQVGVTELDDASLIPEDYEEFTCG